MKMDSYCSSCGQQIPEGQGHYSTPAGLFCVHCGLRTALIPNLIEVTTPYVGNDVGSDHGKDEEAAPDRRQAGQEERDKENTNNNTRR